MKQILGLLGSFLLIALTSCATQANPHYLLDLTDAQFPVMLSGDRIGGQGKTFQLETGTTNITATASTGRTTVTVSNSNSIAPPFSVQVANIFLQDPILVSVKDYSLYWDFEDRIFATRTMKKFNLELKAFTKVEP